jgi:hypothetical protein
MGSSKRCLFAVARTAADAKRAEAEREAIADAQKIVAIWNARKPHARSARRRLDLNPDPVGSMPREH